MQFDIQGDITFLHAAGVLKWLLEDRTTRKHILWGTDAYRERGPEYARDQEMEIGQITGENSGLLKTRAQKAAEQQTERTRQHAEVFTPAWICRKMNDQADQEWFRRENVFFREDGTPTERIDFKRKSWRKYADSKRLEITCGEAPYLVSRYDVSSGEPIPMEQRVGLLDRKLRVVNENTDKEADWLKGAFRAFEATYGYEFQGDNLLIARVNLVMTFVESLDARWQRQPTYKEWKRLARVVTWNIWQMDGLTYTLPYAKGHELIEQTEFLSAFDLEPAQEESNQPYCKIYLWRYLKASTEFRKIKEGANAMKFDFIIGNPPYQEETESDSTRNPPVYHLFMDASYELAKTVELITPARFLFNAGYTPKTWNEKMLNDPHIKILLYEPVSSKLFPNTSIAGGIAISYRDSEKTMGPIGTFTQYGELNSIVFKVKKKTNVYMDSIISSPLSFQLTDLVKQLYPDLLSRMRSSAFSNLADIFSDHLPNDEYTYYEFYGEDAQKVADICNARLVEKQTPHGQTIATGFSAPRWPGELKKLWSKGNSVYLAEETAEGFHREVKHPYAQDYLPIHASVHIDGREYSIEQVDFQQEQVTLRDISAQPDARFPLIRQEPTEVVRSYFEDEPDSSLTEENERETSVPSATPEPHEKPAEAETISPPPDTQESSTGLMETVFELTPEGYQAAVTRPVREYQYDCMYHDIAYLDGQAYQVESIGIFDVRFQPLETEQVYPVARVESMERLETLLAQDERNHHLLRSSSLEDRQQAREDWEKRQSPQSAQPQPEQAPAQNFHITDDHLGEGGQKTKYANNVAAIRTLKAIEAENRHATPEEQEILSRYVGWGGIPQAFDPSNASWDSEFTELAGLLTDEEYELARASTLNAHYTSPTVIKAMYQALEQMGFRTGNILEPSCGVGNFFGLLPDSMQNSKLYGVELDSITGRIARQLYPQAQISVTGFEKTDRRDFLM